MQPPDGSHIVVYGDRSNSAVKIISIMKAQKCMRKGCGAYLAYVLDMMFEVETTVGRSVVISKVVRGCHIDLDGHKIPIKLYPMILGEFDVVLGMDW